MAHLIQWDNDDRTVVLQQYLPGATRDDLYLLAQESAEMLASVDHQVHLIIDERNIKLEFTTVDMQYLQRLTPPNQGKVVMIVPRLMLRYKKMMQKLGQKIAPDAFAAPHFVDSVDEARQYLIEHCGVCYQVRST